MTKSRSHLTKRRRICPRNLIFPSLLAKAIILGNKIKFLSSIKTNMTSTQIFTLRPLSGFATVMPPEVIYPIRCADCQKQWSQITMRTSMVKSLAQKMMIKIDKKWSRLRFPQTLKVTSKLKARISSKTQLTGGKRDHLGWRPPHRLMTKPNIGNKRTGLLGV